ncbi:hypothetical protein I551_1176 [Mycobacterium ulcerans str. Harvey]|uniref:Uncharacterized protein n=1 Tax=Mycobacterium ulcerans str. Harvey TaxID=1299332 RepID=A0ABN0R5D6_MYCUL|nr:hypothetical protein I551_1176 [Mycobacterium ulcerans str. Harvey]
MSQQLRETLTEPAFHAACRNQYQLFGERIRQRLSQERAEAIGK